MILGEEKGMGIKPVITPFRTKKPNSNKTLTSSRTALCRSLTVKADDKDQTNWIKYRFQEEKRFVRKRKNLRTRKSGSSEQHSSNQVTLSEPTNGVAIDTRSKANYGTELLTRE